MATLQLGIDARGAVTGAREFEGATNRVRSSSLDAVRQISRLDKQMGLLSQTARLARAAVVGFVGGLGVARGIRATVDVVAQFEETIATVGVVARASEADLQRFSETAKLLGATTRFSASEAGDGLLFLARAGFDANEAISALPSTLLLAQSGGLQLGEAADFASNILAQFNLEASQTARVVDTLVITSNRANTDVRQLAEAMKFAGPIAGALGIEVENAAAAIGVLGNSGIQSSQAGTNLRGVMLALLGPTTEAVETLEKMGLSLEDVSLESNSLEDVLQKLADAQLSAAEANAIFGRRNAAAALILSRNVDEIRRLGQANRDFRGEAELVAKTVDDTLAGSFKSLRSSLEAAALAIGDAGFRAALRNVVDTTTGAIRILLGLEDQVTKNVVAARILATALKSVAIALTAIIALEAPTIIGAIGTAFAAAATGAAAFAASLAPAVAGLAAIGSVITSFELGRFIFEESRIVQEALAGLVLAFQVTFIKIEEFIKKIVLVVRTGFEVIGEGLTDLVVRTTRTGLDLLQPIINSLPNSARAAVQSAQATLLGFENVLAAKRKSGEGAGSSFIEEFLGLGLDAQKNIDDAVQIVKNTLSEIEVEFNRRERTGENRSFIDFVADDLLRLNELLSRVNLNFIDTSGQIAEVARETAEEARRAGEALRTEIEVAKAAAEAVREASESIDEIDGTAQSAASSIVNFFGDLTIRARDANDAVQTLIQSIAQLVLQQTLTAPIANIISGITGAFGSIFSPPPSSSSSFTLPGFLGGQTITASAFGNAFQSGRVVPFQSGGIIDRPITFGLAGGQTGLAGESGPEAVLPLTRTRSGNLGIDATGVGGNTTVVNVRIETPSPESFRRSGRQIRDMMARAIRQGAGNGVS